MESRGGGGGRDVIAGRCHGNAGSGTGTPLNGGAVAGVELVGEASELSGGKKVVNVVIIYVDYKCEFQLNITDSVSIKIITQLENYYRSHKNTSI